MLHRGTYCAETLQTSKAINTEVGRYVQVNTTRNQNEQTRTYQACPTSCNLERSASQWYAVSHGIGNVWGSVRENNVLNQLYTETLPQQNLEMCFRCSLLSSRIPRSSPSTLTFLSLIKSSPVHFLALQYVQCHAIVRLEISPFSMLLPTVSDTNISFCLLQKGFSLQTVQIRFVHHQLKVS